MDEIYTRCPHCQTVFRITAAHLAAAQGRVRCGGCFEVFPAKQHLVRLVAKAAPAIKPASAPLAKTESAPIKVDVIPTGAANIAPKATPPATPVAVSQNPAHSAPNTIPRRDQSAPTPAVLAARSDISTAPVAKPATLPTAASQAVTVPTFHAIEETHIAAGTNASSATQTSLWNSEYSEPDSEMPEPSAFTDNAFNTDFLLASKNLDAPLDDPESAAAPGLPSNAEIATTASFERPDPIQSVASTTPDNLPLAPAVFKPEAPLNERFSETPEEPLWDRYSDRDNTPATPVATASDNEILIAPTNPVDTAVAHQTEPEADFDFDNWPDDLAGTEIANDTSVGESPTAPTETAQSPVSEAPSGTFAEMDFEIDHEVQQDIADNRVTSPITSGVPLALSPALNSHTGITASEEDDNRRYSDEDEAATNDTEDDTDLLAPSLDYAPDQRDEWGDDAGAISAQAVASGSDFGDVTQAWTNTRPEAEPAALKPNSFEVEPEPGRVYGTHNYDDDSHLANHSGSDVDNHMNTPLSHSDTPPDITWDVEPLVMSYAQANMAEEKSGKTWQALMLGTLAVLLMASLMVTWLWPRRAELREDDVYGPWVEKICAHIECELPARRDPGKIKLLQKAPFKDALDPKKITFDLLIQNNAAFNQAYPDIVLSFTDIDGNTVATRSLHPREYLPEYDDSFFMPMKVPVHISFTVIEPKPTVTGYEFTFTATP